MDGACYGGRTHKLKRTTDRDLITFSSRLLFVYVHKHLTAYRG
jgi:hypothetical protein